VTPRDGRQPLDAGRIWRMVQGVRRVRAQRTKPPDRPILTESQLQQLRALLPPVPAKLITEELVAGLNSLREHDGDDCAPQEGGNGG
jgi:hypothetical protein